VNEKLSTLTRNFSGLNLSKDEIRPDNFPLPTLKTCLHSVAGEVLLGRGLVILRGLDPSKYSLEDNILIYAGIASYVGETRGAQDNDGNVLGSFDFSEIDKYNS
jgi:hypothetical protein